MTHLIIAGHGMQRNGVFDPGATGLIKKGEHKYVVEDLFPAMRKFLPKGHNIVFFDKYKVSNYGNIVALAKKYNASEVTEIHYDAAGSSSASGGHVIIHSDYSPDKIDLSLRDAIKTMVGVRYSHKGHQGISGRNNLYNVNAMAGTGISYRLIELGFGTNENDAKILIENVEEYAKELVKAITGTSNNKEPSKPKVKPTPSKTKAVSGRWATIQSKLNSRYGLSITIDNIPGPETFKAIVKGVQIELNRQYGKGLVVDGIVGPKTRAAFVNVRPGSRGNLTWLLQVALLFKGYDPGAIDGINGSKTQTALKSFQRENGLTVDGIAGKQTWTKLLA